MALRAQSFHYRDFALSADGVLTCDYSCGDEDFRETVTFTLPEGDFSSEAAQNAARLAFLLIGVSYYKTRAAYEIHLPSGLSETERTLLRAFYREGLAEFAFVNHLDLSDVQIIAPVRESAAAQAHPRNKHPLIPFGGGIDSIVVVNEIIKDQPNARLFVANTSDTLFEPIEATAAVTGLDILRVQRTLDSKVLKSTSHDYFNGHVPVTGVLSAIAVVMAIADRRDSVVMSNEHSASEPTGLKANSVFVNHQWSKSLEFETLFRAALADSVTGVEYYSALRPYSEMWVAERFSKLTDYHLSFRSCNRAFFVNPERRAERWCGECDKCCFIDLILSPFMSAENLNEIFDEREPLNNPGLTDQFHSLLGQSGQPKPLECVGDEGECRRAALVAAERADRADNVVLASMVNYIQSQEFVTMEFDELLKPQGAHFLPQLFGDKS